MIISKVNIASDVDGSKLIFPIENYEDGVEIYHIDDNKVKIVEDSYVFIKRGKPKYILMSYATQCKLSKNHDLNFTFAPPSCKNAYFMDIPVVTYNQLKLGEIEIV
jgi:hypothetical protein